MTFSLSRFRHLGVTFSLSLDSGLPFVSETPFFPGEDKIRCFRGGSSGL